ncbi:MAG: HAMP domain-containing sensor histidine kinase, partial [Myxococcota bacterium]|nr:HAMP domain-containing sensor histidine kinase [Myxococcota bacterium]
RRGALGLIYDAMLVRPLERVRVMGVLSLAAECLRKRSAPEGPCLIVSSDGLIHYANPPATQLLLVGGDERVATHLGDFVVEQGDKDLLSQALKHYAETRDPSSIPPFRTVLTTGMGHNIPVEMSPEVPGVEPGAFKLSVKPLLPLNELHLPSDSQQRLEALSQLASRVAQELNSPLQFIGDSVAFLQEALGEFMEILDAHEKLETDPATNRQRVEQLQMKLRALTGSMDWEYLRDEVPVALERSAIGVRRVQSVLEMLRRFAHGTNVGPSVADINAAVRSSVDVTRPRYRRFAEVDMDLSLLPPMVCNVGALNHAFVQILENTSDTIEEKAREDGAPGRISVSTKRVDGGWIAIEFRDDAVGATPVDLEALRRPKSSNDLRGFAQGDGLADACRIVEEHGGVLEMSSTLEQGNSFVVKLPIR